MANTFQTPAVGANFSKGWCNVGSIQYCRLIVLGVAGHGLVNHSLHLSIHQPGSIRSLLKQGEDKWWVSAHPCWFSIYVEGGIIKPHLPMFVLTSVGSI